MKKKLSFLIGVVLFISVFYYTGGRSLLNVLSRINVFYLSLAIVLQLFIIFLYTARLKIILSFQKYSLSFRKMFKILAAGMSVNQLTPVVRAGGEPVKMYYLSKSNIPAIKSSASVIIEISAELISIYITLILLIFILSFSQALSLNFLYAAVVIFIIFIISFTLVFKFIFEEEKIENFLRKIIVKFFKTNRKIDTKITSRLFTKTLKALFKNRRLGFKIFSISFLSRALELLRIYLLFLAINYYNPSILLVLAVWVLQFLFSTIPWLPGGLGLVEGGTISTLLILGLPIQISSSIILLDRVLNFWLPVFLGAISLYILKKEFYYERSI